MAGPRAAPLVWDDIREICEGHQQALAACIDRADVRVPARLNEPCLCGFFRPTILLPAWRLDEDAPWNLAYILLHGAAHRRTRDHWFLWFRRAVETAFSFHPAVWFTGQKVIAEAENACDEAGVALAEAEAAPSAAVLYSAGHMRTGAPCAIGSRRSSSHGPRIAVHARLRRPGRYGVYVLGADGRRPVRISGPGRRTTRPVGRRTPRNSPA